MAPETLTWKTADMKEAVSNISYRPAIEVLKASESVCGITQSRI